MDDDIRRRYLLKRISQGDEASFEKLYAEFSNKVYGYLKVRFTDENLIRDGMQEIFLAIWRNAGKFSGNSPVQAWVFGIVRNKAADLLRDRYSVHETPAALEEDQETEEDFSEELSDRLLVQELLGSLPEAARELLYLVFNVGLSYQEAAQVLGIPEGTVKSRMYGIKNTLRKIAAKGGMDSG